MKPLISVVVPVYNVEKYLSWCLDSLKNQTLEEIEIICVNDGSTDNSRAILEQKANEDKRITIVDKPNGGLSSARNAGIKAATGDIICFLDSDDRFTPHTCKTLVETFEKTSADIITFGASCYPESDSYPWLTTRLSPRNYEYAPFSPDLLFKEMSTPFAWRVSCKRSFLVNNSLFFDETLPFGEDEVFLFEIYPRAKKTVLISNKLYDYRVSREGSLMSKINNDPYEKGKRHLKIAQRVFSDWKSLFALKEYNDEIISWSIEFVLYGLFCLNKAPRNELIAVYRRCFRDFWGPQSTEGIELPPHKKALFDAAMTDRPLSNGKTYLLRLHYLCRESGLNILANKMPKLG